MPNLIVFISVTNSKHEITSYKPMWSISGKTQKDLIINAIRQFEEYRNRPSTKELIKAKIIPTFSKWEFGLRTTNKSKEDVWWIVRGQKNWIIRKYNKPDFIDMYYIPFTKVKSSVATEFMEKINIPTYANSKRY